MCCVIAISQGLSTDRAKLNDSEWLACSVVSMKNPRRALESCEMTVFSQLFGLGQNGLFAQSHFFPLETTGLNFISKNPSNITCSKAKTLRFVQEEHRKHVVFWTWHTALPWLKYKVCSFLSVGSTRAYLEGGVSWAGSEVSWRDFKNQIWSFF